MNPRNRDRRRLLALLAALSGGTTALGASPALRAAERLLTPAQSRGPFYPLEIPLDADNDLVQVSGRAGLARGTLTNIVGRVLDAGERPIPAAKVEIWQCDANGRYHHPGDRRAEPRDPNFQGYGRMKTADDGAYRFRTIRPVAYPGRAPHIHFAVSGPGIEPLVTQMYVAGEADNERDFLLSRVRDPRARASLIVELDPDADASAELIGRFDLVLVADGRFARANDDPAYRARFPLA